MFWNGSAEVDVANGDFQHDTAMVVTFPPEMCVSVSKYR